MDGTTEFVAHRGEFAVMIGLEIEGKPVLGVVYQPTESKLYYAVLGEGAYVEEAQGTRPLRVSSETDPSRIVIAVSRSHDSADAERVRRMLRIERVVFAGSAGLKAGMISEGLAHLYMHIGPGTNEWDTCAPEIILREAGGKMTDVFNVPLRYNAPDPRHLHGFVASNGVIHDQVLEAVRLVISGAS
jgi:3'(2'), 5'-bisphosphate nucleotidase